MEAPRLPSAAAADVRPRSDPGGRSAADLDRLRGTRGRDAAQADAERVMKTIAALVAWCGLAVAAPHAQEPKPVPKDSARVSIPGCSKGYIFTAAARTVNEAGSNTDI